jgi:hypothetical protein
MAAELRGRDPARFLYPLGDIVCCTGEEANYRQQFLEPYAEYTASILAIGPEATMATRSPAAAPLAACVTHFCASTPTATRAYEGVLRTSVTQPNVYRTLEHDWITIIGAYTNVPAGGIINNDPVHGANPTLGATLDQCFAQAARAPDAVFVTPRRNPPHRRRRLIAPRAAAAARIARPRAPAIAPYLGAVVKQCKR